MESRSEDKPESKKLLGKINDDNTLLDKIKYHKTNILLAILVILTIIGFTLIPVGLQSKIYALTGVGVFLLFVPPILYGIGTVVLDKKNKIKKNK